MNYFSCIEVIVDMRSILLFALLTLAVVATACTTTPTATQQMPVDEELALDSDELSSDEQAEATSLPSLGSFSLDTEESVLRWQASKILSNYHTGTVKLQLGNLQLSEGAAQGEFVIDMTSIDDDDGSARLVSHLKSEDFFAVDSYPTSTLTVTALQRNDGDSYIVTGDLTILGITNEIVFPAQFTSQGELLRATADIVIDRTRWNMTYSSGSVFKELGDNAIKDEVGFTLELVFTQD